MKDGDLRTHVESDRDRMSQGSIDVQSTSVRQGEFSRCINRVADRQKRWREKRWFALSTMCVTRQNPSTVSPPHGLINNVRIVTKHECRAVMIEFFQEHGGLFKIRAPVIIESRNLQTL